MLYHTVEVLLSWCLPILENSLVFIESWTFVRLASKLLCIRWDALSSRWYHDIMKEELRVDVVLAYHSTFWCFVWRAIKTEKLAGHLGHSFLLALQARVVLAWTDERLDDESCLARLQEARHDVELLEHLGSKLGGFLVCFYRRLAPKSRNHWCPLLALAFDRLGRFGRILIFFFGFGDAWTTFRFGIGPKVALWVRRVQTFVHLWDFGELVVEDQGLSVS